MTEQEQDERLAQVNAELEALQDFQRVAPEKHNCYANAWRFVQVNADWALVHGIIGEGLGHAWAEKEAGGTWWVYDPTHDALLPRAHYHGVGQVAHTARYTWEEASALALRFGHYGSWDPTITAAKHREEPS